MAILQNGSLDKFLRPLIKMQTSQINTQNFEPNVSSTHELSELNISSEVELKVLFTPKPTRLSAVQLIIAITKLLSHKVSHSFSTWMRTKAFNYAHCIELELQPVRTRIGCATEKRR